MERNKIYNIDCVEGMKMLDCQTIDLVLTSPPYNIIRPNSCDRGYDLYKDGMSNDEYIRWTIDIFKQFSRILKPNGCILWNMSYGCENTTCMSLTIAEILKQTEFTLADIIVWKKQSATPNNVSKNKLTRICEFVYVFCRKDEFLTFDTNKKIIEQRETGQNIYENIFNYIVAKNNDEATELNKATFSTEFCDKLLNIYAKPNSIVLDCFMGTGTTAISCIRNNLNFVGYEISKAQCDYASQRIEKELQQCSLFRTVDYFKEA